MSDLIEVSAFISPAEAQKIAQVYNRPKDSETAKHRQIVLAMVDLARLNGVDLGSSGDPIVPNAIQVELPPEDWHKYNTSRAADNTIQWRGSALSLPFKDNTLDFVHSSHLLEDFPEWEPALAEWDRVLKPGGYLIIAVPDHERFRAHVRRHKDEHGIDVDNLSHKSEHLSHVGAISDRLRGQYDVIMDRLVSDNPREYSIIFVGRKTGIEWAQNDFDEEGIIGFGPGD